MALYLGVTETLRRWNLTTQDEFLPKKCWKYSRTCPTEPLHCVTICFHRLYFKQLIIILFSGTSTVNRFYCKTNYIKCNLSKLYIFYLKVSTVVQVLTPIEITHKTFDKTHILSAFSYFRSLYSFPEFVLTSGDCTHFSSLYWLQFVLTSRISTHFQSLHSFLEFVLHSGVCTYFRESWTFVVTYFAAELSASNVPFLICFWIGINRSDSSVIYKNTRSRSLINNKSSTNKDTIFLISHQLQVMAYSHCRIRTRIPTRTRISVLCRNLT